MGYDWRDIGELYFDSDSSLLKRIGRESISNPIVAIVELIKNSYDADSTKVTINFENIKHSSGKIMVVDNGDGMTSEEITKKWMILAVPDKEKNPFTKKRRIKIGEKGIGRIGLEGLSKKLIVISKPKGKEEAFKIEIDWEKYIPGILLDKVGNKFQRSKKDKKDSGFEIILEGLLDKWDEEKINQVKEQVSLITPIGIDFSFNVGVSCPDYPHLSEDIESKILKKNIFHFKAELDKKGNANYWMKHRGGNTYKLPEKNQRYLCGPIYFEFFFFYRVSQKYPEEDIDIQKITETLDKYGGVKLYRDNFIVKLQRRDWLNLDQWRVQDSKIPGSDQIFGFVKISKMDNPEISDTTNRENLVENTGYKDMISFLRKALDVFKTFRKSVDGKTKEKSKIEEEVKKDVKKFSKKLKKERVNEPFLNFSREYPLSFYKDLEDEINNCIERGLPNATLLLCRKVIENLLYNILEEKYRKKREIWWDNIKKRPHMFSTLLENLVENKEDFEDDEKEVVVKFNMLIKPFIKKANDAAHKIMEYLEYTSELKKFKIPENVQLLLLLYKKIKK